ncbi:hypothetical protein V1477_010775 [Vespula maculifrons]|uniref:Uncharacterized protein n=1 Tax=Vespula maculifrons TaxID=7453 RepID=A0ABD2C2W6_VESMC
MAGERRGFDRYLARQCERYVVVPQLLRTLSMPLLGSPPAVYALLMPPGARRRRKRRRMNRRRRSGGGEEVVEEEEEVGFSSFDRRREPGRINCISSSLFRGDSQCRPEVARIGRRSVKKKFKCKKEITVREAEEEAKFRQRGYRPGPSGDLERQREALRELKGHSNGGKAMELLVKRERNTTGDYLLPRTLRFLRGAQWSKEFVGDVGRSFGVEIIESGGKWEGSVARGKKKRGKGKGSETSWQGKNPISMALDGNDEEATTRRRARWLVRMKMRSVLEESTPPTLTPHPSPLTSNPKAPLPFPTPPFTSLFLQKRVRAGGVGGWSLVGLRVVSSSGMLVAMWPMLPAGSSVVVVDSVLELPEVRMVVVVPMVTLEVGRADKTQTFN